jgi:tetratricopeptide (TPR) repeat protein
VARLLAAAADAQAAEDAAKAEELLRLALDVDPTSTDVHVALGRHLYVNGQGAEGIGLLWRAVELDAKHVVAGQTLAEALLAEADYYVEQGDTSNADASVARADEQLARLDAEPEAQRLAFQSLRVRVLMRVDGQGEAAFERAFALAKADPSDLERHALLVEAAGVGRGFDAALAWYDEGTQPTWQVEWFAAGCLAARATWNFNNYVDDEKAFDDYEAAEKRMQMAGRLRPDYFDAASERVSYYRSWSGWIRHREERLDEAFELFNSAWGRHPLNENAVSGMFWVAGKWYELGEMEKAREGYRVLCSLAPDRSEFWNNYGLICRDTGHYEESFRAYRKAMELLPDDPRIVNDCALILLYHLRRDLDQAELWLIRAEDLSRANLAAAENEGDEARVTEQRLILGDALVNLARLYGEQQKMAEAAEHWNELRALDSTRDELPENRGR